MSEIGNSAFVVSLETAAQAVYDAVIVGSGVSGSVIAKQLALGGQRVLIVEAGPGNEITVADYEESVQRFYGAASKDNNAAYAENRNAPMPRDYETRKLQPGVPNADGYLVQHTLPK